MQKTDDTIRNELRSSIVDILSYCDSCRLCLPSCPLFNITDGWITQGASGLTLALYTAVKWGIEKENQDKLRKLLYSCTTCGNCDLACKEMSRGVELLNGILKGRKLLVEEMIGPMPLQSKALESLISYGNPYGHLPADRSNWTKGLDVPDFSSKAGIEVLYYAGCTPSYDERAQNVARAIVKLLKKAGIKFGVLMDEECCGCPADRLGEEALFQEIAGKNFERFESLNVGQIITTSPHCYDTFKNCYPAEMKKSINIKHYTQFFSDLIDRRIITFKNTIKKKITYHDPCYLGRHNSVYEEPRNIIKSIPGNELVEMKRCRADSPCCGGGGGRMWADFEETAYLSDLRIKDALEVGADILVTACPFCLINMEDAIKRTGLENSLVVKDITELMLDAI